MKQEISKIIEKRRVYELSVKFENGDTGSLTPSFIFDVKRMCWFLEGSSSATYSLAELDVLTAIIRKLDGEVKADGK